MAEYAAAPKHPIEITVTYVQMLQKPARAPVPPPRPDLSILRAHRPTVSFYRYLYNTVGGPWLWHERRRMTDEQLAAVVQDPHVEVHVLYAAGVPAGYVELDRRSAPDIEIAYFGLMPEFIGQRLGPYLLGFGVDRAWSLEPRRLWLHTCTLDAPQALEVYRKGGFEPYRTEVQTVEDPRHSGLF